MGLRCLLGHDFGEPELEREREEQGNEVVITVREVEICSRCGTQRVVSENKEVTSVEQLAETATADAADDPDDSVSQQQSSVGVTVDEGPHVTDDAEVLTDDDSAEPADGADPAAGEPTAATESVGDSTAADAGPVADASPDEPTPQADGIIDAEASSSDAPADADADAEPANASGDGVSLEDDGIIIPTADREADDRRPGEWPEYETVQEDRTSEAPWPEHAAEDTGFDADAPSEGAPEQVSFGGGFTPEITGDGETIEPAEEAVVGEDTEFTRAEPTPDFEPTAGDVQTEFFCPECGHTRVAGGSSMRAGDICPECRRGYISERPL